MDGLQPPFSGALIGKMNTGVITALYIIQAIVCGTIMFWLWRKYRGNKVALVATTLLVALLLIALALHIFIIYAAVVLILVLLVRWLMAEWQHPKYGGIVLGLYFGFFISFPIGVYQYAH